MASAEGSDRQGNATTATRGTLRRASITTDLRTPPTHHPAGPDIDRIRTSPTGRHAPWAGHGRWTVIAMFCGMQLTIVLSQATGPFLDEGIYITSGLRTLEGHGVSDGYLTWFAGSLAWPTLAGSSYAQFGLVGTRLVAVICVTLGVAATLQAVADLHGARAALLATLVLVPWGPLLALAHLGVYDALAVTGLGCALLGVARTVRHDHRGWLALAGLGLVTATAAKYPALIVAVPLAWLLVKLRGSSARIDVVILVAVVTIGLQLLLLPQRSQIAAFIQWRLANDPAFGVTRTGVAVTLLWLLAIPMALALPGTLRSGRSSAAVPLLCGALLFPTWHMVAANSVGASKHAVFSAMLLAPLIGDGLDRITRSAGGVVTVMVLSCGLAVGGVTQMQLIDRQWSDVRRTNDYLATHVKTDDHLLIPGAWRYTPALYDRGTLASPWQVYDGYRVSHGQLDRDVCSIDWFVAEERGYGWPSWLHTEVQACNAFEPVHRSASTVTNFGDDLRLHSYDVVTTVWRNTTDERS